MLKIPRNRPDRRERGTALIEFALVLPLLIVLTLLVVDFGRAFYVKNLLEQAAREGARRLAVGSSVAEAGSITRYVASASGIDSTRISVTALDLDPTGPNQVRMTVTMQFNWLYPGVFGLLGTSPSGTTLTGTCAMRREY